MLPILKPFWIAELLSAQYGKRSPPPGTYRGRRELSELLHALEMEAAMEADEADEAEAAAGQGDNIEPSADDRIELSPFLLSFAGEPPAGAHAVDKRRRKSLLKR